MCHHSKYFYCTFFFLNCLKLFQTTSFFRTVDSVVATIDRLFSDMTVNVSRPFATNAVLQITLGRVLKAVVAFKGLMIEWVVVRGYMESMDLWSESRHKVFRKVTENSHAAMLHFYSPTLPELAVRSFMVTKITYFVQLYYKYTFFNSCCTNKNCSKITSRLGFTVLIHYLVSHVKGVGIIFIMLYHLPGGISELLSHFMKSANLKCVTIYFKWYVSK